MIYPDWFNTTPTYTEFPVEEFKGNPLIESLNPPASNNDEAILRLLKKPKYNEDELDISPEFRKFIPANRLTNFMLPTSQHLEIMSFIYIQIFNGYAKRNPLTPEGQFLLHEGKFRSLPSIPGHFPSTITFITGLSGMGKSTLVNAILDSMGKAVIIHSKYHSIPFNETQILYLKRNIPDQISAKLFAYTFGIYTDSLLNQNYYRKIFSDKSQTRTHYVGALRKIIINNHVGAIVLDDFQNLSIAHSGGKKELIALILNLREELGVPIIIIGTNKAAELLLDSDRTSSNDESILRRLIENGYHKLERPQSPDDKNWKMLCGVTWRYQWLKNPVPISDNIIGALFDCSQGITGIMLTLFITCQVVAIDNKLEKIDEDLIKKVYKKYFIPLHGVINTLRSGELNKYDSAFSSSLSEIHKKIGVPTLSNINSFFENNLNKK